MVAETKDLDYRQRLTDKIITQLEAGTAPWQKPWEPSSGSRTLPYNPSTDKPYKGANSLILAITANDKNFDDPRWATYKQAAALGWQVKKGETATQVEHWKFTEEKAVLDKDGKYVRNEKGEIQKEEVKLDKPQVFRAHVFNAKQIDGVPELSQEPRKFEWEPEARAEQILQNSGAVIHHDQADKAFYNPHKDEIHLPKKENFKDAGAYYSTALHEVGHWTGEDSRLNRNIKNTFGSPEYAKEELRAELASYFLADKLGIPHDPGNHASYVKTWVKTLHDDKNEIFKAARDAEKITDYVLALDRTREKSKEQTAEIKEVLSEKPVRLEVPFKEKDQAKQAGAKWDIDGKSWVAPAGSDLSQFEKWITKSPAKTQEESIGKTDQTVKPPLVVKDTEKREKDEKKEKVILNVPFTEKNEAKSLGAQWDKEGKTWVAPEGADISKLEKWLPKKSSELKNEFPSQSYVRPHVEFAGALKKAGLVVEGEPVMDGKLHRVAVDDGKPGHKDGAYIGHLDGRPSGFIQNHKTGFKENWKSETEIPDNVRPIIAEEVLINKERRAAELHAQHLLAADKALEKWNLLSSADEKNGYLARKQVNAFDVKTDGDKLVVPVRDADGKLWSLQSIPSEEGQIKTFEKDSRKSGNMHVLGEIDKGREILVAEGYATAASIHQATGKAVVVAFDSGNIDPVVQNLKEKFPTKDIHIMADNDLLQKNNVGLEKAEAAAKKHDVGVGAPEFKKAGYGTDFNDLHVTEGLDIVKKQVETAISKNLDQSRAKAVSEVLKSSLDAGQDVTFKKPGENTRHTGKFVSVSANHSVQDVGSRTSIVHENSSLSSRQVVGQVATVQYAKSKGLVIDKKLEQSKGVSREMRMA